ncbi:sulfur carrier protein ThiS adenylyltransferase ThiF [Clostridium sp. YIM B02505]|uniref:Sulfur carrier protein ThiS adenylyltransferase ThiF n=1 Tax=Clostridium yunnanense TaxID=2800325 RepID=A0ABS1EPZ2_9CLOT|nr:sulfur carrier protein ThiS adenylyltransferase ThiF [Clostridium yunnanense]MBK1811477.1 sulfur carrier protein ThiS adenylyltransferase ThiF [Clostridium yunnanense]
MKIYVNEVIREVSDDSTAYSIREVFKADADILIYNSFPLKQDIKVKEFDKIVLIKRGEMPSKEELEALMVARHTPFVHEELKKAKVGIAGLGGLGSNAAVSLARMGIGSLLLIDYDIVEPSNLNRQYYFVRHIGMKKTEAMKDIIRDCNPFVEVEVIDMKLDENNIKDVFKDVDIIIEAFDDPTAKATIVRTVLSSMKDKKIIAASGVSGFYSSNTVVTRKLKDNLYMVGDLETEAGIGCGLMASRVAVAANHEANAAVRIILGEEI